jgi:hypothetical protein
MLGGDVE